MQYLEIINSVLIGLLVFLIIIQNNKLKFMKAAMESYQPEKLMQAQKFIEIGNEHKINYLVSKKLNHILEKNSKRYTEINKKFLDSYKELTHFLFSILVEKDWEERENILSSFPNNAKALRQILEEHDNGTLYDEHQE